MNECVVRCSSCGELYENTIDGLNEHYYGDNPFARYHREINSNRIEESKNIGFLSLFKKPKITYSALEELLDYKSELNSRLLKSCIEKSVK